MASESKNGVQRNEYVAVKEKEDTFDDLLAPVRAQAICRVLLPYEQAKSCVDKINERCASTGKLFADSSFGPTALTLNRRPADEKPLVGMGPPPGQWCRPGDFLPSPVLAANGRPSPSDCKQGLMSNCWLVGGIASLSVKPALISNGLYPWNEGKINPHGVYLIKVWRHGKWFGVIVDDYCFAHPTLKEGYFMHAEDKNVLWSMLYEKAFAKLFGSYQDLWPPTAMSVDPLYAFAGCSISWYSPTTAVQKFERIHQVIQSGGGLAGVGGGLSDAKNQVVGGHAYTLLDTYKDEAKGLRLLKLRNTWGSFEWNGDWSDESEQWDAHPELKKKLQVEAKNDGLFWINCEDFARSFAGLELARFGDSTQRPADEFPVEDRFCFSDTYEDYRGSHGFEETTSLTLDWSPGNRCGGLLLSSSPMLSFVVDRDLHIRVKVHREDTSKGTMPWATVCRSTEPGVDSAGRVLYCDVESNEQPDFVMARCEGEVFKEVFLPRSPTPYVIVPFTTVPAGQITVTVKGPQNFSFTSLPECKSVAIEDEFTEDNSMGTMQAGGPQYLLEVDDDLLMTCQLDIKADEWDLDEAPCNGVYVYRTEQDDDTPLDPDEVDDDDAVLVPDTVNYQHQVFNFKCRKASKYIVLACMDPSDSQFPFDITMATNRGKFTFRKIQ